MKDRLEFWFWTKMFIYFAVLTGIILIVHTHLANQVDQYLNNLIMEHSVNQSIIQL